MKKNKKSTEIKSGKSLDVIVKELLSNMEAETAEAYQKWKLDPSLPPAEMNRYFEYWRGLSRMEALVRRFMETNFTGIKK